MSKLTYTVIHGSQVPVAGENAQEAIDSFMFREWAAGLDPYFRVRKIAITSVDFAHDGKVRFIKFSADVVDPTGEQVPGIVFMRGGSVVILPILSFGLTDYVILTLQPRLPSGQAHFPEIPAGTMEGDGEFAGAAAREIAEETGITIGANELTDLTALVYGGETKGIYSTPGGSDEFLRVFLFRKEVDREFLEKLEGKCTGLACEGEKIILKIVKLRDLAETAPDSKTLAAITLYETARRKDLI